MKENNNLSFYKWIHSKINEQAYQGYLKEEQIIFILRQFYNLKKRLCPMIIQDLKNLEFIKLEGEFIKVEKAKSEEETLFELEKKYNILKKIATHIKIDTKSVTTKIKHKHL